MVEKHEESFRVIDRRLFSEDGELRKEVAEQARREEEAAAKKPANAPASKSAAAREPVSPLAAGGTTSGTAAIPESELDADASVAASDIPPSRGFQMLVDFLTRNAAAMLGGMADPRTGKPFVDIEGAREMIDMLDALRETTRGNLAKVDDDLLIEVIGSLKLTFMEISKATSEAMAKKAKGQ